MKTIWNLLFIVLGLLFYLSGCSMSGGSSMIVSLFGACVMMVGLFPYLDKWTSKKTR